eukprot:Colp12_sorted_trinity150504_noHs@29696
MTLVAHPPNLGLVYDSEYAHTPLSAVIIISAVGFWFVYKLATWISTALVDGYKSLERKDRQRWGISTVRALYGMGATITSFFLLWDGKIITDLVKARTWHSDVLMAVSVGFFVFECIAMVYMLKRHNIYDFPLWLHHILCLMGFTLYMRSGSFHFFAVLGLIQESSAFFTSLDWMLLKVGKNTSLVYVANQVVSVSLWVVLRVFNDIVAWLQLIPLIFFKNVGLASEKSHFVNHFEFWATFSIIVVGYITLAFYLNPMWLSMKAKKLMRSYREYKEHKLASKSKAQ